MFGSEKFRAWLQHPGLNGGSGGGGTSKTTNDIPAELKPLATEYTNKAIDLSRQGFDPYTGQRYADLNDTQNLGIGMVQDRALNGSQTFNNADNALNQQISGQSNPYMQTLQGFMSPNANPYLDSMYDAGAQGMLRNFGRSILPGVNSTFSLNGRYGSNAHQTALDNASNTLASNLGNMATNMYGNAYTNDMGRALQATGMGVDAANQDSARQMQAIGMAPGFANQQYQDASQLLNAGQLQQDNVQNNLDFGYNQFQEAQNLPYKQLASMSGVFGSNLGSTSKTTSSGGGK